MSRTMGAPWMRAAALGAASGARTSSGITQMLWTIHGPRQPERLLSSRYVRIAAVLGSFGEIIGDKLPQAPPRTAPLLVVARLGAAAVSAWLLSRRESSGAAAPILSSLLASTVVIVAGPRWRDWAQRRFGYDIAGALIEDAAVVGLAYWGAH